MSTGMPVTPKQIEEVEAAKARRDALPSKYKANLALTPVASKAVRELIDVGLIPAECTHFELILDRNNAIQAKATYFVSEADLQKVADAFKRHPEEVGQIMRSQEVRAYGINEPRKSTPHAVEVG
jgi:hypothetical protein